MHQNLPFYVAVLHMRTVYDKSKDFLRQLLGEEVTAATFTWSGEWFWFDVNLTMDSEDIRKKVLQGVYFHSRSVSWSIEMSRMRDILGPDAEALLYALDEVRMLDGALAELERSTEDPHQALGNRGLVFSMSMFDVSYGVGVFKKYNDNWDIRKEVFTSAMNHYQARMSKGRKALDPLDDNAPVQHYYYDGTPSPCGEEQ